MVELLMAAVLIAILGVSLRVLHKVQHMHKMTYVLATESSETHREVMSLYAQLQSLAALERQLALAAPLPPLRGWAGSPDFLLQLALEVGRSRPRCVLECSSGVSTLVVARSLQQLGQGHVYSLEHEAHFAEQTRALLRQHGLTEWATVIDAPLETGDDGWTWYRLSALPQAVQDVALLVIDGPPASVGSLARYPALQRLRERLAPSFALLLDDAGRVDETEVVKRWCAEWPTLQLQQLPAEKGLVRLARAG
jgi:hypothetical protein